MTVSDEDSRSAAFSRKRSGSPDEQIPSAHGGQEPQAKRVKSPPTSFLGWNRGVKSQIRARLGGRPSLGAGKVATIAGDASAPSPREDSQINAVTSDLGAVSEQGSAAQPVVDLSKEGHGDSSSEEGEIRSAFSGDDEAVVINLSNAEALTAAEASQQQDSDFESGEITDDDADGDEADYEPPEATLVDDQNEPMDRESDLYELARPTARDKASGTNDHEPGRPFLDGIEEDERDNLMDYASGKPNVRTKPNAVATHGSVPLDLPSNYHSLASSISGPSCLGDLSYEDLRQQLRYFHVGRPPEQISLSTPVHCTTCGQPGHLATLASPCSSSSCIHCGAVGHHLSAHCPSMQVPCARCRERGHKVSTCTAKLRVPAEQVTCTLCGCRQHAEEMCESRWRTSTFPPPEPLPQLTVRLYCYECGQAGHLGNDCPTRRPAKGAGSSMWSRRTMPGGILPAVSDGEEEGGGAGMTDEPARPKRPLRGRRAPLPDRRRPGDAEQQDLPMHRAGARPPPQPGLPGPPIQIRGLANARGDLHQLPPPPPSLPPPPPPPPPPPSSSRPREAGQSRANKYRRKKRLAADAAASGGGGSGGSSYRPMPSAAKRAYIQGRN